MMAAADPIFAASVDYFVRDGSKSFITRLHLGDYFADCSSATFPQSQDYHRILRRRSDGGGGMIDLNGRIGEHGFITTDGGASKPEIMCLPIHPSPITPCIAASIIRPLDRNGVMTGRGSWVREGPASR